MTESNKLGVEIAWIGLLRWRSYVEYDRKVTFALDVDSQQLKRMVGI